MAAVRRKWSMTLTLEDMAWIAEIRRSIGILYPKRTPPDDAKIVRAALEVGAEEYARRVRLKQAQEEAYRREVEAG